MLNRVKELSAEYLDKLSGDIWDYSQVGTEIVSPDNDNLSFDLRKIDGLDDVEDFSSIINFDNGEYFIKSDYFINPSEWYQVKVKIDGNEVAFEEEDSEGKFTVYGVLSD